MIAATSGPELGREVGEVDAAVARSGADFVHRVADEGGGRRIGAVRGGGHQHRAAVALAARFVRGLDGHQAAELAVGAGLGRHGATAGMPVSVFSQCGQRGPSAASAPCAVDAGCSGWMSAKPGSRAIFSLSRGLCFIVHEPSG